MIAARPGSSCPPPASAPRRTLSGRRDRIPRPCPRSGLSATGRAVEAATGDGPRKVIQAYKFALDPAPAQERALRSYAGGARFAASPHPVACRPRACRARPATFPGRGAGLTFGVTPRTLRRWHAAEFIGAWLTLDGRRRHWGKRGMRPGGEPGQIRERIRCARGDVMPEFVPAPRGGDGPCPGRARLDWSQRPLACDAAQSRIRLLHLAWRHRRSRRVATDSAVRRSGRANLRRLPVITTATAGAATMSAASAVIPAGAGVQAGVICLSAVFQPGSTGGVPTADALWLLLPDATRRQA